MGALKKGSWNPPTNYEYWIVELSLLSWKCWWYCLYFASRQFHVFVCQAKIMLILMFSNVWAVRPASSFSLRADIFSCCKVFETLYMIAWKRWLKFSRNKTWTFSFSFYSPKFLILCQNPSFLLKIAHITLTRLRSYPRSFWNTLP